MAGEKTIGDFVTLQRGITYKGNLVGKPGPALLGLGSIHPGGGFREGDYKTYGGECPPKLMLFPGDLFVSLKGATKDGKMIGSVARVPSSVSSGRLTQDTVKLEFRDSCQNTKNYVYWVLRTPQYRDYCEGRATGSAVVALSRDDFLNYPIPPLTVTREQIVALLETLEDKIELNRKMNATLEAMARALFKSWFVDFDPVRRNIARQQGDPVTDDAKYAELDALFPAAFEDSPLGKIPQGLEVRPLGECALYLSRGVAPKYVDFSQVHALNQRAIRWWNIDSSVLKYHDSKKLVKDELYIQRNDVVVNSTGDITIGRAYWFLSRCLQTLCGFSRFDCQVRHDVGVKLMIRSRFSQARIMLLCAFAPLAYVQTLPSQIIRYDVPPALVDRFTS